MRDGHARVADRRAGIHDDGRPRRRCSAPDECRDARPLAAAAEPYATTVMPRFFASSATSMFTLLMPECEKIHIVSRGSNV